MNIIRKLFLLAVSSQVAFISCSNFTENDSTITNNSSKSVSFTPSGYGDDIYTLSANASMSKDMYSWPSCTIKSPKNPIAYKSQKDGITFYDRDFDVYTWMVTNPNDSEVTVSEKGGLVGDNGESFTISADSSVFVTVYTKSPTFIAIDSDNNQLSLEVTIK